MGIGKDTIQNSFGVSSEHKYCVLTNVPIYILKNYRGGGVMGNIDVRSNPSHRISFARYPRAINNMSFIGKCNKF